MNASYDVVIVGGGLVGLILAHALHGHGLRIAIIDAKSLTVASSTDGRSLALSASSYELLKTLGLWEKIAVHATPIKAVHISRRGVFSKTHLRASEVNYSALGYVVPAQQLAFEIMESAKTLSGLSLYPSCSVEYVKINDSHAQLTVKQGSQLLVFNSKLLVAADGSQSFIAKQLHIHQEQHDYQQTAIVTTLKTDLLHHQQAYERFTPDGVIALLPVREKEFGVVWTATTEHANTLLALSAEDYLLELKKQMGHYWGKNIQLGERSSYPLVATKTSEYIRPRVVMMGNAAHTLHPVAAQGLNLALRSVAWLAEVLTQEKESDIGQVNVLKKYSEKIKDDHEKVQHYTHGIVELSQFITQGLLWNVGLSLFDKMSFIKKRFIQRAMGLSGKQAKLVRGVSL